MLRIAFAALIFIHALIHLMGFILGWKIARLPEMSGKTLLPLSPPVEKTAGIIWLANCMLFMLCGLGFILNREWWMTAGIIAVIVSQLMVILYWRDAKAGTIANLIIFIGIALSCGSADFSKQTAAEVERIHETNVGAPARTVSREMLAGLPEPVGRWLLGSGIVGRSAAHSVHLVQKGMMRTKPGQDRWMKVEAEQDITINEPAFVWKADIKMIGLTVISARDSFIEGKGRMTIKLLSLIMMDDADGMKIDQAAMQRYLVEMIWYPWAALSPYVKWEAIDSRAARVVMKYRGVSGSCVFHFNEAGEVVGLSADRYMGGGEDAALEKWVGTTKIYGTMGGIRMPVNVEVGWKLRTGDFTWYKFEIERLEYGDHAYTDKKN